MTIRVLRTDAPGFRQAFAKLRATHAADQRRAEDAAAAIVAAVRRQGDKALIAYTKRFDGAALTPATLRVPERDLVAAEQALPAKVRGALRLAARRIRAFHARQRQASWRYRDAAGLELGQNITPLRRVGVYVPGGHAAYPSSVLMNVIPARVAGVEEVIMVSPAGRDGHPIAVLAAARIAGATAVYRVGGAQAVAALAYGTRTIARVDKIVGPGNAFVQAAKRQVYGQVDIDSTAGPSEVLVIADATADPAYVAADLLAQAEHGSGDESAILLTPSVRLAAAVQKAIVEQLAALPRRAAIERILRRRGALIVTRGLDEAVELAEAVAPEHLELLVRDPGALTRRLRNAGAIFEGAWAPAPLGDYLAGPNHVLPTGGSARFFSPLGTYHFVKRTSVVRGSAKALRRLGPAVETLAALEGYQAHAAAIRVRLR
ncbi:MAG: histidinol dehydrogenase [Deltaproteobacteria bacterium]|nr:histidinol dehydrogenase [Deltaproteobacteria bacterium]